MKPVTREQVVQWARRWDELQQGSRQRAKAVSEFIALGEQWDETIRAHRSEANKETLTFNLLKDQVALNKANGKKIELTLVVKSLQQGEVSSSDMAKWAMFQRIVNHIVLNDRHQQAFSEALDRVYDTGQAVLLVTREREDEQTLNERIRVECLRDMSMAFFDPCARGRHFNDGRYCGLKATLSREQLLCVYPKAAKGGEVYDNNVVFEVWFKQPQQARFVELVTGVYKREDLLTPADVLCRDGKVRYASYSIIRHRVFLNTREKPLVDGLWPGDYLPLVYHYGRTVYAGAKVESFPDGFDQMDAQRLHNLIGSQIATNAKNFTGEKWLLTKSHVLSAQAKRYAASINQLEGAVVFDKDPDGHLPQPVPPSPIAQGLAELYALMRDEIRQMKSPVVERGSEVKLLSGVAIDRLFDQQDLLQSNVIKAHVEVVNRVGKICQRMIPKLYTASRVMHLTGEDDRVEQVRVNYRLSTEGALQYDLAQLNACFDYEIKAGLSTALQHKTTLQSLQALFAMVPGAASQCLDIYAKMMPSPYAQEIARRFAATMDQALIGYASGELTQAQYQKLKQAQALQQRQADPAQVLANAKASAAQSTAATKQYAAQTARLKLAAEQQAIGDEQALERDKLALRHVGEQRHQSLEELKVVLQHAHALLGRLL